MGLGGLEPTSWDDRYKKRKDPKPEDTKKKSRINRQSVKRKVANEEYQAITDIHRDNNPSCPGCGRLGDQFHHIARGANRDKTLTNTDLGINGCKDCHDRWDNKAICSVAEQFAIKFVGILRRYQEIVGKRISVDEVINRMSELEV